MMKKAFRVKIRTGITLTDCHHGQNTQHKGDYYNLLHITNILEK